MTSSLRSSIHIEEIHVKESEDIADEFSCFAPHQFLKLLETFMHEYTKQRSSIMRYRKLLQNIV